ncbi:MULTISPECIES: indole-3-glycerol phosphate synthase TrpC [Carnobacterium]|uniref:Indole-3-glycerol phosphate synthase n=2 Tax=Carnobacterium TaxID=2747 RepID=A0ABW4NND4_9LACT|nr:MULTISPECIES: indole-3-glycerol phosphate synthase TrpC [unclassified Carnobacterium]ALV22143.1 Indole-3-glycerol phosphate synthase [Carnobacterium sp. CP1]QQP70051.1 indole-3-glycerol phosphate synthase TrpC [Carnobacterium sp. CS13]
MILDKISAATKHRVARAKEKLALEDLKKQAFALPIEQDFPFETALAASNMSFICEVKKASPSKGVIAVDFPYQTIAQSYEAAGAAALSVLTEPDFFQGENKFLSKIKRTTSIPILRKDFIVDEYQIYESKVIGADAILLIAALLETEELKRYQELAHTLGMSALVEVHSQSELKKSLSINPRIIGVNNRNLKTFEVDIQNAVLLRNQVPQNILFIAESGIKTRADISLLEEKAVNGVLIGETLMQATDKQAKLAELRGVLSV